MRWNTQRKEKASETATSICTVEGGVGWVGAGFWGGKNQPKPRQSQRVIRLKGCLLTQGPISRYGVSSGASVKFVDRTICFLKP